MITSSVSCDDKSYPHDNKSLVGAGIVSLMENIGAKMPERPHNFAEKRNLSKTINLLDFFSIAFWLSIALPATLAR